MGAEWSSGVVAGVERWAALEGGPHRAAAWVDLGPAVAQDDGRLVVDARDRRIAFLDACLAGELGPEFEPARPVEELRDEAGVLVLRPQAGSAEEGGRLWGRSEPVVGSLLDGLRAAAAAPLGEALAARKLAGKPTSKAKPDGLVEEEAEAFRACLSPGLRLVWAPPGTGKAQVQTRAIEALVADGKRVLFVSTVDEALDEALAAAVERMSPEPGVAVRVGAARDPVAAAASAAVDEEAAAVAAELRATAELAPEVERLRAELGEFDEPAYRVAAARVTAGHTLDDLRPRLAEAEAADESARRAVVAAATELGEAVDAQAALGPVRDALEHQRLAVDGLAALEARQRALQEERNALAQQEPRGRRARRQHRRLVEEAGVELRRFAGAAADGRRRWLDVQLQARAVIGEHTQADVDDADLRVANAEAALAAADEEYRGARELLIRLRGEVDAAEARGEATDEDRRLVADSVLRGLPERHARLYELVHRRNGAAALEARHRELVERGRALRADAEARLVRDARLVATTLTRSRVHPALAGAEFDVVLVDGAGAAPLAEVLLVLCRATTTAVLFGDFLQLGPAVPDDPSPDVQRWVRATCFSHLGITSPADVDAHDGCVALTRSRLGATVCRLANETSYERLRAATGESADIVLVDVSTVPGLAAARPGAVDGRWSAAGAVLARALAERHVRDGTVGVVAPDVVQADVTLSALRDHGLVAGTAVAPVQALQGRGFATLVLDLAAGAAGPRTFGAGVALAGERLYVIADGAADGPLRAAVERGEVRTWSAAALLGAGEPPGGDATFGEVGELLRADVHEGAALDRHLADAQRSVWMWAPWPGDVDAPLRDAARRGARVRVFAGPGEDAPAGTVIRSDHEHGGIVVVDERVVLLVAGDGLVAVPGPAFAGRLLAELQAEWTGEPRTCGECGEPMEVRRGGTADVHWLCPGCHVGIPEQRHAPAASPAVS
ncbi:AAA domain-containing protein [Pseudonocardia adelaidensis]|uniref:DNA2/NAM7 helicase helicase domain-containing protein n=1 Tax=Pseudonocardia adelaidensis TaxID=648754 RepID=A0ABP9NV26_9PSEU